MSTDSEPMNEMQDHAVRASRRAFLGGSAALVGGLWLSRDAAGQTAEESRTTPGGNDAPGAPTASRPPLAPTPFLPLPLGSVRPEGWLRRQLELQKAGLTGAAEGLYDALTPNSGWLGGDGEAWEKGPYYVRGLVALAHTLDDAELKSRAGKWVEWALKSQRPDGFFGPASNDDWWPRMVVLYILRDHQEATGDDRVVPFFLNYFRHQLAALPRRPLHDWGRARAGDNLDVVLWTYDRTGEPLLLDLARLLVEQAYPWTSIFTENRFYDFGDDSHPHHIVNVSQALKMAAVAWRLTKSDADHAAFAAGVAHLDRQYGRIDGQISGTEMLSGRRSTDGVELCADVERIISNGIALKILGDAALGDQLEKVAYNSLPAHTSPRLRQITYYQLVNQVACTHGGHGFTQDYANANMPGPHSGFPCCCYNWHAAWPKFIENLWAATADGGLAAVAYGPTRVTASVAGGVPVTVTQETDYPFGETITLRVAPERAARFPLALRMPAWCENPRVAVNGEAVSDLKPGTFHRVERDWKPGDVVELTFPMEVRASRWVNDAVGIERGPLAYTLKIDEDWQRANAYAGGFDEFEVRPRSAWNYALEVDPAAPKLEARTQPMPDVPFDTAAPPVVLTARARRLPSWGMRTLPGTVVAGRANRGWQPLKDASVLLDPGVPHRVRVEARGPKFRVFVDDMERPLIEQTDETFAADGIGLRAYEAEARFRDVTLDGKPVADFAAGWKPFGGEWVAQDGEYVVKPARDAKALLAARRDLRDFVLEATVTVGPAGDAGLIFRVTDPAPELDGYRGYYVGLKAGPGKSEDAEEPPQSPVASDEPTEEVELIPVACAKLRVSYFPVLGTG